MARGGELQFCSAAASLGVKRSHLGILRRRYSLPSAMLTCKPDDRPVSRPDCFAVWASSARVNNSTATFGVRKTLLGHAQTKSVRSKIKHRTSRTGICQNSGNKLRASFRTSAPYYFGHVTKCPLSGPLANAGFFGNFAPRASALAQIANSRGVHDLARSS
jgi:hypothetical protein